MCTRAAHLWKCFVTFHSRAATDEGSNRSDPIAVRSHFRASIHQSGVMDRSTATVAVAGRDSGRTALRSPRGSENIFEM